MHEEVLPGLHRIELPLPKSPLKAVNCYLIRGEDRWLLIDTGMHLEECQKVMNQALDELGVDLDKTDFFITHFHSGIEAMLSGTPVIAFNRGAMSELIIDGVTGFLCDNEEEMLSAINKIEQLSPQVCRAHVIKYFSSYAMYQKHQELLDLAGQGSHW